MRPSDPPPRPRTNHRPHSSHSRGPSGDGPHIYAVPIQCQYCSGQSFRRSRLRSEDLWQMIFMRYPVRCIRCSQRQMVSFSIAGISLSSLTRHERPTRSQDTWKNWTEPTGDTNSHDIPHRDPLDD
ncbi:MAG: hypothetical protein ABI072_09890 [Edaphobacter sp.]